MTEKLIECVRKHPCLYDTKNSSYKNVASKAKIWEQIGKEINTPSDVAKKKWKGLRDNYGRYKKGIAGTTGQAAKKFVKWPWIAHLQFLDITLTERERASNVLINTDCSDTHPPESPHSEVPSQESPPGSPPPGISPPMTPPPITHQVPSEQVSTSIFLPESTPARPYAKKCKKDFNEMDKVINFLHNKKKKEYDAVDHLFQSYAQTFKSFSKNNQIKLKVELAKLFADVEANELQEKDSSIVLHSPAYSVISNDSDSRIYEELSSSRPEKSVAARMSQPVDSPTYSTVSQPTQQSSQGSLSHEHQTLQLSNVNFPHVTIGPTTSAQNNDMYINAFDIFRPQ